MVRPHSKGWYASLARLTREVGKAHFFEFLSSTLSQIIHIDCTGVIFYDGNKVTNVFEGKLPKEYSRYLDRYLDGMYLLDPHYSFLSNGVETGLYHFKDIEPDCFHESKYYKSFVKPIGITDEYDFIVNINNCYVDFYLNKLGGHFSQQDKADLIAISPMITQLIEAHWEQEYQQASESVSNTKPPHYNSFFDAFGKSILTKREQEVVKCILHGHSSKSLASKLNISLSTVNIHHKNIYQKLDIATQSELFSLCIQSLSVKGLDVNDDPLQYLSNKQAS